VNRPASKLALITLAIGSLAALNGCQPDPGPKVAAPVDPDISISDPWMRAAPPSARVLAGYLVIENPRSRPVALVGAASPIAGRVEIHETVVTDGLASMERRDRLEIAPGGRLVLEPGGAHLMFIEPSAVPADSQLVPVELLFESGERVAVELVVRAGPADGDHEHHHHHDDGEG
jgi:copper(I)-binding protein